MRDYVLPRRQEPVVHKRPPIEGGVYLPEALEYLGFSKSLFYQEISKNLIPKPQTWVGKSVWLLKDLERYVSLKTQSKGA